MRGGKWTNETNNVDEKCHLDPKRMKVAAGRAFQVMDTSLP